uniref:Uncharacterized protein n=1 Tax=Cacopsylla melanoneura TaxID=428564 RepID=A0A8D8PYK2_9HEMI
MENLEESNPLLKILKLTKFAVTDSVVHGANLLTYNLSLEPFMQSMNDIGPDNCVLPEKLVKYKVCTQNKFRSKEHIFDDDNLRSICTGDIECLEREIKDMDRVLMEKRKVNQLMRNEISWSTEDCIPKAESQLSTETRTIEANLANFIELNEELNTHNKTLHQHKQRILDNLTSAYPNPIGNSSDAMYCTFDYENSLSHLMQRMNTDFNVLCKYINSTSTHTSNYVDLECDIELLGKSIPSLKTKLEEAKSKNFASEKCAAKLMDLKKHLARGTFKWNMFNNQVSSTQQLRTEINCVLLKIQDTHIAQSARCTQSALRTLYSIRVNSLDSRITLLNSLATGMSCMLSVKHLLVLLIEMERDWMNQQCSLVYDVHGELKTVYSSLCKQEMNLKQLLKSDTSSQNNDTSESTAQQYGKQLIGQYIRLEDDDTLDTAVNVLNERIQLEKERVKQEYCMSSLYRKLAPLRQRIKCQSNTIYSGPTPVPVLPLREHNEIVLTKNMHLNKLKAHYEQLLKDIQNKRSEVQTSNVVNHHSLLNDSGIDSRNNFSL